MLLATGGIDTLKNGFSGSSIIENYTGFQTSGFGYRACYYDSGLDYSGSWQTVSPIGIFSGESNPTVAAPGFGASGSLLRVQFHKYNLYGGWVTFDIKTKQFTGNSIAQYNPTSSSNISYRLTTAGGLIRYETSYTSKYGNSFRYAEYISLT